LKKNNIFFIAEIGVNHNGVLDIAKQLIDMAKRCGCDAVKFQKRTVDKVYTEEFLNSFRESPWGTTQRQQKFGLEFNKDEYDEIDEYCKKIKIEWFASAWDDDSQIFLDGYDLKYNKIASPMITHKSLVNHIAKQRKKTFISTGMSSLKEIDDVVNKFVDDECPFVLMHCTSIYPCPNDKLNLNVITKLIDRYDCEVGYSGHSSGILDTSVAVVLGATYLEKHISLDRAMYGSDQSASLEEHGLWYAVRDAHKTCIMLGDGKKRITDEELKNRKKLKYWETSTTNG